MNKKNIGLVVLLIILIGAYIICKPYSQKEAGATDYKHATYTLEDRAITLTDEMYFGNEVKHDLNNDGREDIAFLVAEQTGGTGTFFYLVAALNTPNGYVGSHGFFLGDRIAPQSTHIDEGTTSRGTNRDNVIVVNYAERGPNTPFTEAPTVNKSVWLKLNPSTMQFAEVEQNFEGQ